MLKEEPRKYLLSGTLFFFSIIFSLLIGELLVKKINPQNLSGSWRVQTAKGLLANKSSGSSKHQLNDRIINYNFYYPHLRGTPIKNEVHRVLVLGDSYTFGWLVEKKHTYVQLLQSKMNNLFGNNQFYLLNAAAGGWGTADYVAFVQDFGELINPDIILVFISTDDIGRSIKKNIYTFNNNLNTLERNHIKVSNLKKIVNSLPKYQWFLENSHLIQLLRNSLLKLRLDLNNSTNNNNDIISPITNKINVSRGEAIKLGKELFSILNAWTKKRDITLLVTTTGLHDHKDSEISNEPTKAFMSIAQDFFNAESIPFFDIFPYVVKKFDKNPNRYRIIKDGHPNEEGHKLISNSSWNQFLKNQFLSYCQKTKKCFKVGKVQ